eukprot:2284457-Prymnesium_polylepis.1
MQHRYGIAAGSRRTRESMTMRVFHPHLPNLPCRWQERPSRSCLLSYDERFFGSHVICGCPIWDFLCVPA